MTSTAQPAVVQYKNTDKYYASISTLSEYHVVWGHCKKIKYITRESLVMVNSDLTLKVIYLHPAVTFLVFRILTAYAI